MMLKTSRTNLRYGRFKGIRGKFHTDIFYEKNTTNNDSWIRMRDLIDAKPHLGISGVL